jgi:DNA-binding IclR family transcriptional regulator
MLKSSDTTYSWTFFSNNAHVLVCLAEDPSTRLRDVAEKVGITERAAQRIVTQLEEAGVLSKERVGRRNSYSIDMKLPLRHPLESHRNIGSLLGMVLDKKHVAQASKK